MTSWLDMDRTKGNKRGFTPCCYGLGIMAIKPSRHTKKSHSVRKTATPKAVTSRRTPNLECCD